MSPSAGVPDDVRHRILALLGIAGDGQAIEVEPAPAAGAIGASGAIGYAWPDGSARASVYVFDGPDAAQVASATLHDAIRSAAVAARSTINGGLLLWATARRGDDGAETRIGTLAERFDGRE